MTKLDKWVEEVRKTYEKCNEEPWDSIGGELPKALRIIERMREVLSFYANKDGYTIEYTAFDTHVDESDVKEDRGKQARNCLKEVEEEVGE